MERFEKKPQKHMQPHVLKGALAGLIGGLIATAAKTAAESVYPPRTHGEPEPPPLMAEKIVGHPLRGKSRIVGAEAVHWGFGAATGALYGALAEIYPPATAKNGVNFGLALCAMTHEGALPAMGLSAKPSEQQPREKRSEVATHVVYGVVTEVVRRLVRPML